MAYSWNEYQRDKKKKKEEEKSESTDIFGSSNSDNSLIEASGGNDSSGSWGWSQYQEWKKQDFKDSSSEDAGQGVNDFLTPKEVPLGDFKPSYDSKKKKTSFYGVINNVISSIQELLQEQGFTAKSRSSVTDEKEEKSLEQRDFEMTTGFSGENIPVIRSEMLKTNARDHLDYLNRVEAEIQQLKQDNTLLLSTKRKEAQEKGEVFDASKVLSEKQRRLKEIALELGYFTKEGLKKEDIEKVTFTDAQAQGLLSLVKEDKYLTEQNLVLNDEVSGKIPVNKNVWEQVGKAFKSKSFSPSLLKGREAEVGEDYILAMEAIKDGASMKQLTPNQRSAIIRQTNKDWEGAIDRGIFGELPQGISDTTGYMIDYAIANVLSGGNPLVGGAVGLVTNAPKTIQNVRANTEDKFSFVPIEGQDGFRIMTTKIGTEDDTKGAVSALGGQYMEFAIEMLLGGAIDKVGSVVGKSLKSSTIGKRLLETPLSKKVGESFVVKSVSKVKTFFNDNPTTKFILQATGLNSVKGEIAEEIVGDMSNSIAYGDDYEMTTDYLLRLGTNTALVTFITGGGVRIAGAISDVKTQAFVNEVNNNKKEFGIPESAEVVATDGVVQIVDTQTREDITEGVLDGSQTVDKTDTFKELEEDITKAEEELGGAVETVAFDSLPEETQADISANILELVKETNLSTEQLKAELKQQIELNLSVKEVDASTLYDSANISQDQFSEAQVSKLKGLIEQGQKLDPILVSGDTFIDGVHRLVAYKELGLSVPVVDISSITQQLKGSGIVNNAGDEVDFGKTETKQPQKVAESVKEEKIVKSEAVIPVEGKPFEFSYVRNTEKAPNMGSRFGQDIEPSGRYMTVGVSTDGNKTLETGIVKFNNPLVIDFGGGYGENTNWKNVLSKRFGGKKGLELSRAIQDAGYDGIVTVSKSGDTQYTSEIVDLTKPKTQKEQVKEVEKKKAKPEKKEEKKEATKKQEPKKETTKKQETKKEEIEGLSGENQKRFTYKGYEFVTTEYTPRATPSSVPLDTSKKVLDLYGQTKDGWTFVENKMGLEAFTDEQLDGLINKYKDRLIKAKEEKPVQASEVTGMSDEKKLEFLNNTAQDMFGSTFDKLTPKRQLEALMNIAPLGEGYIRTADIDILTKLGKGVGTISLSDMGDRTEKIEALLWGKRDGMYTDGMILLTDKTVANKVVDKFKDQYIKKYAKQNGISVQEAQKQIVENNKDREFPATKDILDSAKANFKLEPIGFYVDGSIRQTGSVIFRAENGTLVRISGKYYSAIKSFYPNVEFYITDESNVKPISFVVGKIRKGIVMPMVMPDDSTFTNLVGKEDIKVSEENEKVAKQKSDEEYRIQRAKELTKEDVRDDVGLGLQEYIYDGKTFQQIPSHKGKVGYLEQGTYKYDEQTGVARVTLADGREFEFDMQVIYDNTITAIAQSRVDGRTWFEETFGVDEFKKRFPNGIPKKEVAEDDDIAFYTTARRQKARRYDEITSMADIRRNLDVLRKDRLKAGKKEYYHSTSSLTLAKILDSGVLRSELRGKTSFADTLDLSTEYGDIVFVTSQISPIKEKSSSRFGVEYVEKGETPFSKIDRVLIKTNKEEGLEKEYQIFTNADEVLKKNWNVGRIAGELREAGFEVGYIVDGKEVGEDYFTTDDDQLMLTSWDERKTRGDIVYHGTSEIIEGDFKFPLYLSENKEYADIYQRMGASSMGKVKKGGGEKTYAFKKAPVNRILDTRNENHLALLEEYFADRSVSGAFYPSERGLPDWTDAEGIAEFVEEMKLPFDALLIDEQGTPDPLTGGIIDRGIGYVALNKDGILPVAQPEVQDPFKDSVVQKTVYHGTNSKFDKFSYEFMGTTGTADGYGFYFTDKQDIAKMYVDEKVGRLIEANIDIKKPLSEDKITITKQGLAKLFRELDPTGEMDVLSNFGDVNSIGYENLLSMAVKQEFEYNGNDVDMAHDIMNMMGRDPEKFYPVLTRVLGYDGIISEKQDTDTGEKFNVYVVFSNDQIQQKELPMLSAKEDESKGSVPLEQFEQREVTPTEQIRIADEVRALVDKYAFKIGEKYLPKKVLGVFYTKTKEVRVKGLTDLYVASHEIGHAIDNKFGITAGIAVRDKVEMELRDAYINLYPTAKETHAIKKQKLEGFAMAVATYSQRPTSFTQEYPNIVKEMFTQGGKYFNPELREYLDDISLIVSKYQSLNDLDRIATRISKDIPVVEQTLFKSKTEATINMIQNDLNLFERWVKENGDTMTKADFTNLFRFRTQVKSIYENNIATNLGKQVKETAQDKKFNSFMGGLYSYLRKSVEQDVYMAYDPETKNIKKVLDFNWGTLRRDIAQKGLDRQFNSLLVARRAFYDFEYADKLTTEIESIKQDLDGLQDELIAMYQKKEADRNKREEKALEAEIEGTKVLLAQVEENLKQAEDLIRNDGWDRQLVTDAYQNNQGMFERELDMFDKLVAQDILLAKDVGIISQDKYNELKDNKGYAPFKRIIYDEVLGEVDPSEISGNLKLSSKEISSLKKRTGSTKEIIYPLQSAMRNHMEFLNKSVSQDAINTFLSDRTLELHASNMKQVEWHKGIENQNDILIRMENGVRKAYAVDPMIKEILSGYLSPRQVDLLERVQQTYKQMFTMGTTGTYFQFVFTNLPRDAFNYITQTYQSSSIKAIYNLFADTAKVIFKAGDDNNLELQYFQKYLALGGRDMTFIKYMEGDYDAFTSFLRQEEKGLKKVLSTLGKGVKVGLDILSMPSQISEMWYRSVEFIEAKKSGDSDVVALEKARRVTTPFHHKGSFKFKDKQGKIVNVPKLPRYAPFQNASLQAFSWAGGNFISNPKIRSRMLFMIALTTALGLEELLRAWNNADDDDKEQFLDLSAEDLSRFIHIPKKGGGISRVAVAEWAGSIAGFINMATMDFILDKTDYSITDYSTALTTSIPDQFNLLTPVVKLLEKGSWDEFGKWATSQLPALANPIIAMMGYKTYPEFAPLESTWQKTKLPADRYNEGTSKFAKWAMNLELPFDKGRLGDNLNLSPIQLDALLVQTFGRSITMITGKKGAWDALSSVNREYYFEYGRRLNDYWDIKEKNDQLYNSMTKGTRSYSKEQELEVFRRKTLTKDIDKALDSYKVAYDSKDLDEISRTRARVIDLVNRFNENPSTPEMEMYLANPNAKTMEEAMRTRALGELSMKDPRDYTKDELAEAKALAKEFRQEALLARSQYSYSELLFGINKNDDKVIKIREVARDMSESELKKYLASLKYAGMISNDVIVKLYNEGVINYSIGKWANDLESNRNF